MERKEIPISKKFFIDVNGNIFDSNGKLKNIYTNGDGYKTVNIKLQDNRWVTFGVHRLVALTFLDNKDLNRTEVNHRDCNIENNNVTNLEWVTPYENNIHAEIMRTNNIYTSVYSSKNGVAIKQYINAHSAAQDNNCTALDVWDSIKDGKEINGIVFNFQKQYIIFKSATEFIKYSELSKKAVTTSLIKNQIRQIGYWIALYLNPENVVRLKSYVTSPVET